MRADLLLRLLGAKVPRDRVVSRVKLRNCPVHGSHCKAQDPVVFARSHSGVQNLKQPKYIFI